MFRFPWGDMHSLNLGWFLQKFNELREDWATAEAGIDGALDAEIQRAEDALSDVFDARDAAAASATAAAGSATAAGTSATAAQNSATAAGNSATLANQKATAAGLSEAAAAQSASAAGSSATAAATSATQAGNSASAAQSSAAAAAASIENIPSFAYPIVDNGAVENAHPVASLNITKRGAFYKITGTRGSLGAIINLAGTNFELLTAADYYPNAFNICPDIANAELVVIARGSAESTLTGERLGIGLAEFSENPTSGESIIDYSRRLGITEESFDIIKAFPLESVRGAKVRPFVYLRANGNYDVEICFYLSFNNSAGRSLQGLLSENEIDTKENINETEDNQTEKQL